MNFCVLDTNAILQRFQPSDKNAQNIIDAIYENKKIELYIPHICFSETIQQFYSAHKKSQTTSTPMSVTDRAALINRLRQDIKGNKINIYPTEQSLFARTEEIFTVSFSTPRRSQSNRYIDMADMLVIATALEFKNLSEQVEKVYIFSSDFHLLDTATALKLICFDPASPSTSIDRMPECFDRRMFKRNPVSLNTVCKDCETSDVYGSTKIIDICEYGLCIEQTKRNINIGDRISLSIPSFGNLKEDLVKTATAVRLENSKVGLSLEEPLPVLLN